VILRLAIGWHFFKEGVSHHTDSAWSSEGFLRQAKGPLSDMYQSVLPSFHGWNRLMLAPPSDDGSAKTPAAGAEEPEAKVAAKKADTAAAKGAEKKPDDKEAADKKIADKRPKSKKAASTESPAYKAWLDAATADWRADAAKFAEYYHLNDEQKAKANQFVDDTIQRMDDELAEYEPDIRIYQELAARAQAMPSAPGAKQIPNEVARSAAAQQNPLGERGLTTQAPPMTTPAVWQSNAKAIDQLFHDQLGELRTDDQRAMPAPSSDASRLRRIDTVIAWTLMIVGGLLIVGLFTRLAAVVGAVFLLSIICAQPPWLATSVQTYTYNQTVEMLALLALATTPVGRWGGLDYFIGLCCRGCCRSRSKTVAGAPRSNLPPGVAMPPALKKRLT
jgi:uncharacterized membrane protein YphA (DoxX/SURF4 family)